MGAFGSRNGKKIAKKRQAKFLRQTAIIISSENIPATATLRRAIFHRAQRRKFAMKVAALAQADAASISILRMQLSDWAKIGFGNATEICLKSMKRSPVKTHTKCPCEFIRRCIIRWVVSEIGRA